MGEEFGQDMHEWFISSPQCVGPTSAGNTRKVEVTQQQEAAITWRLLHSQSKAVNQSTYMWLCHVTWLAPGMAASE